MTGHRKFSEIRARIEPERRARNDAAVAATLEEMALGELRRAKQLTQHEMARILEADQGNISKLEQRTDMYISTLRRYIEALGGTLEIIAHFRNADVRITQFEDTGSDVA